MQRSIGNERSVNTNQQKSKIPLGQSVRGFCECAHSRKKISFLIMQTVTVNLKITFVTLPVPGVWLTFFAHSGAALIPPPDGGQVRLPFRGLLLLYSYQS